MVRVEFSIENRYFYREDGWDEIMEKCQALI